MSTKLSQSQLTELFIAATQHQQALNAEMQRRIQQSLGIPWKPESPSTSSVTDKVNNAFASLMAERLYADDRDVPLLSSSDIDNLVTMIIDEMCETDPDWNLDYEERQTLGRALQNILNGMLENELAMSHGDKDKDLYDVHHQWVSTIVTIADEQGKTPTDIILSQEGSDEVQRRLYSKSQFVKNHVMTFVKIASPDAVKQTFIQPIIEALAVEIDDEKVVNELRREMEENMGPEHREPCAKMKQVFNDWLAEETARIYA